MRSRMLCRRGGLVWERENSLYGSTVDIAQMQTKIGKFNNYNYVQQDDRISVPSQPSLRTTHRV